MQPAMQTGRLVELDALRGLAAVGVLAFHFYLFWKWLTPAYPGWASLIFGWSPLHVMLTGKTTTFFFVLSGLVLTYPYFIGRPPAYLPYVIKRVLRIYVPLLVSLAFAVSLLGVATVTPGQWPPEHTFKGMWTFPLTWELVLSHALLLGDYNVDAINPVLWSLVHEMRLSLLTPLIVWSVCRFSWQANMAGGLALAWLGALLHMVFQSPHLAPYKTLPILLMFIVGALLARHLSAILAWYRALPLARKVAFSSTALLTYTYVLPVLTRAAKALHLPSTWIQLPAEWITVAAVAGLIVTALGSCRASASLRTGVFRRLSELPYGIYLYHLPILYFVYHMTSRIWPLWLIFAVTVGLTTMMAVLSRKAVELPIARLAHQWASRFRRPRPAESAG